MWLPHVIGNVRCFTGLHRITRLLTRQNEPSQREARSSKTRSAHAWNTTSSLHRLSCPLLAVQGRQDQYGTLAQLEEIKREVPQTELLVVDQCRHIPQPEQPQVLLDGITRFLGAAQG